LFKGPYQESIPQTNILTNLSSNFEASNISHAFPHLRNQPISPISPFNNVQQQFYNQSTPFYQQPQQFYNQLPQFYNQSPQVYYQQSNLPCMYLNQNQAYSYDQNEAEDFKYAEPEELSQPDELAFLTIEQFRAVLKSVFNSKNPKLQIYQKTTYEFQKQHDLPAEAGSVDREARTFEMLIKNIIQISNVELLEIEENQEIVNPQAKSQSHNFGIRWMFSIKK